MLRRLKSKPFLFGLCLVVCALSIAGLVLTLSKPEAPAAPKPDLAVSVHVVPQVMSAIYKCYGSTTGYLALTEIKNNGNEPVTNFHIAYSVPEYADDAGQHDWPVILPGQTIRDYCRAKFDGQKIRELSSETGAQLDVTYTYDGCSGPRGDSTDFTFLAHNEMVWTYIPRDKQRSYGDTCANGDTLAAFVTKDDPAVNHLAKQLTPSLGTYTDEDTIKAARAIFLGLRDTPYRYISEPGTFWADREAQVVQLPSETIANNAGNCADLSVLFAALFEAVGVKSSLCIYPTHVQVIFWLPESEQFAVLEETDVDKPTCTFAQAVNSGISYYNQQLAEGDVMVVDVQDAWSQGMVPSW